MSLILILALCALSAAAAIAITYFNIWLGLICAWPIYKFCDMGCRFILSRDR